MKYAKAEGITGVCHIAKTLNDGKLCAIKVYFEKDNKDFVNEVDAYLKLKKHNNKNILQLICYGENTNVIKANGQKSIGNYIAIEFAKGGDIMDQIFSVPALYTEDVCRYFFK